MYFTLYFVFAFVPQHLATNLAIALRNSDVSKFYFPALQSVKVRDSTVALQLGRISSLEVSIIA